VSDGAGNQDHVDFAFLFVEGHLDKLFEELDLLRDAIDKNLDAKFEFDTQFIQILMHDQENFRTGIFVESKREEGNIDELFSVLRREFWKKMCTAIDEHMAQKDAAKQDYSKKVLAQAQASAIKFRNPQILAADSEKDFLYRETEVYNIFTQLRLFVAQDYMIPDRVAEITKTFNLIIRLLLAQTKFMIQVLSHIEEKEKALLQEHSARRQEKIALAGLVASVLLGFLLAPAVQVFTPEFRKGFGFDQDDNARNKPNNITVDGKTTESLARIETMLPGLFNANDIKKIKEDVSGVLVAVSPKGSSPEPRIYYKVVREVRLRMAANNASSLGSYVSPDLVLRVVERHDRWARIETLRLPGSEYPVSGWIPRAQLSPILAAP